MNHPLPKNKFVSSEELDTDVTERAAPTWLTQRQRSEAAEAAGEQYRYHQEPPASSPYPNSEAYEQYRHRILSRQREHMELQSSRDSMPIMPPRPTMPVDVLQAKERQFASQQAASDQPFPTARPVQRSRSNHPVMLAGLAAIMAGGTVGLGITQFDKISNTTSALYGYAAGLVPGHSDKLFVATTQHETTISKKPISIASLNVADVNGTLNSMIPLVLSAAPAYEDQVLSIKVSGLPKSAYLSAGTKISDSTWLLKEGEINGLNLVVPQSDTPKFDVSVAAIETKTGELAAPVKEMTVALSDTGLQITPASAPPETFTKNASQPDAAAAVPLPLPVEPAKPVVSAEVSGLLEKGDMLLKSGDLIIARQFFTRAFEMGAPDGAMGVAKTYDPATFTQLKVQGIAPDPAKAKEWYEKAKTAGVSEADTALTQLSSASQP